MKNGHDLGYKLGQLLGVVATICFMVLIIAATAKLIYLMF